MISRSSQDDLRRAIEAVRSHPPLGWRRGLQPHAAARPAWEGEQGPFRPIVSAPARPAPELLESDSARALAVPWPEVEGSAAQPPLPEMPGCRPRRMARRATR